MRRAALRTSASHVQVRPPAHTSSTTISGVHRSPCSRDKHDSNVGDDAGTIDSGRIVTARLRHMRCYSKWRQAFGAIVRARISVAGCSLGWRVNNHLHTAKTRTAARHTFPALCHGRLSGTSEHSDSWSYDCSFLIMFYEAEQRCLSTAVALIACYRRGSSK